MSFSRFTEAFDGLTRPGSSAAWGKLGDFRGHHWEDQPRIPAGCREGGQWTYFADGWTRIAANETGEPPGKPPIVSDAPPIAAPEPTTPLDIPTSGPREMRNPADVPAGGASQKPTGRKKLPMIKGRPPRIRGGGSWLPHVLELWQALQAYREQNEPDLFDYKKGLEEGTVALGIMGGIPLVGTNENYPTYADADWKRAFRMRDALIRDFPTSMWARNLGRMPRNAVFHAEATLLLRAAELNGGTLAGKTIQVVVDHYMCWACERVLPLIGLKLGNPTVTFTDHNGKTLTLRDGKWIR